jgi:hypothetical protein
VFTETLGPAGLGDRRGERSGARIAARPGGFHQTCRQSVILPRTMVNRTALSEPPGASQFEVSRSGRRNTAVAYRPRTLIDTILAEHSRRA